MNDIDRQDERLIREHNQANESSISEAARLQEERRRQTLANLFPPNTISSRLLEPIDSNDYSRKPPQSKYSIPGASVITPEMARSTLSNPRWRQAPPPNPAPVKNPSSSIKLHVTNVARMHMDLSIGHIRIVRDQPFTIFPDKLSLNDMMLIQKARDAGHLRLEYLDGTEAKSLEENPLGEGKHFSKFDFLAGDES